jgi:dolichyl-phosphate-mannose--protein O-mannosyl transferase
MMRWWEERDYGKRRLTIWVCVVAASLFAWFYPVLTGATMSREVMNIALRWLPSWGF